MNTLHPWQRGPADLIEYALSKARSDDELSQKIAFIIIDAGVESLLKTYLLLNEKITKTNMIFVERQKYAKGNFHNLLKGIELATRDNVKCDLTHVEFYHRLRNDLHHQGNGINVSKENLKGYKDTSIRLLKTLLDVDLTDENDISLDDQEQIRKLTEECKKITSELKRRAMLMIEKIEPKLVYPSVMLKLEDVLKEKVNIINFNTKILSLRELIQDNVQNHEIKEWLLDLIIEDVAVEGSQTISNVEFLLELIEEPLMFYLLILGTFYFPIEDNDKEVICHYNDISFISYDEYHIIGLYSSAIYFMEYDGSQHYMTNGGKRLIERVNEINSKLKELVQRIADWDVNNEMGNVVKASG